MTDEVSSEEEVNPLSLFPEEWREPVTGLAYLGQLTESVEFCGHTFTFRTLLPQDKLGIGIAMQPYRNTIMEVDAFQAAHVAAALTAIDHREDFCPAIGPNIESHLRGRLNWLSQNLYPPTLAFLWTAHQLLEAKALQAVKELDRLSMGSRLTNLPPWLDSLNDSGSSPEETNSDTQPSTPSS